MAKTFWTREFYKPKGAARVAFKNVPGGEAFWVRTPRDRFHVVAFKGKAQKPFINLMFGKYENMVKHLTQAFAALENRVADRKREREVLSGLNHGVKIGDIFASSWGYEQTNVSFYQVVELKGKSTAVLRRIAGNRHYDGPMSGKTTPVKDAFLENREIETKRIQISGKKPDGTVSTYFRMESYEYAYPYRSDEGMRFSEWH